jgi:hypothetical protein
MDANRGVKILSERFHSGRSQYRVKATMRAIGLAMATVMGAPKNHG